MDSQDPSIQPERKGIKVSRLIVILVCLAAVAAAGIAIRTRVLTKKVAVQQPSVSRTVQPAPSKDIARAQVERTPADKQKPGVVVDMRGKGKIKREEVFAVEETVGGIEQTRMSREGEGERERERERERK